MEKAFRKTKAVVTTISTAGDLYSVEGSFFGPKHLFSRLDLFSSNNTKSNSRNLRVHDLKLGGGLNSAGDPGCHIETIRYPVKVVLQVRYS